MREEPLGERAAALERLEREAQRAKHFALLGRLAAGMSHELRNPLATLFLHVELLEEELHHPSPDSPSQIAQTLAEIKTHLARLEALVQDYLSLVRVDTLVRTAQDLGAAMQTWAMEWQILTATHGITLRLEGVADLGQVPFQANMLRRALLHLVHNAVEAMPSGGTLTVAGRRLATQVQIRVQDTGRGVPAERLAQIFEPLYTTKPGGTGLGLYLVQEIVTAHEGRVIVESDPGHGATFALILPQAMAKESACRGD